MKIIKKAFRVWVKDLSESFYYDDIVGYGNTPGEAKSDAWANSELKYADKLYGGGDVTFLDLKAKRFKEEDIVEYESDGVIREVKRYEIERLEWMKGRDSEALKLTTENPDSLFLVYNGSYGSYWGSSRCDYTSKRYLAGKYSGEEAYKIVKGSDFARREVVELLDAAKINLEINEKIDKLSKEKERLVAEIETLKSKLL